MPIDASIISGLKPMQSTNPLEMYEAGQRVETNRLAGVMNGLKMDEYQRGVAEQNSLRDVYKTFGANSTENTNKLYSAGLGKQAGEYAKSAGELAKDKASTNKSNIETQQKVVGMLGSTAYALSQSPTLNIQEVQGAIERLKTQLPVEYHSVLDVSKLPQDPEGMRRALTGIYTQSIETEKLMTDATSRRNTDQNNATSTANNTATNATSRSNNAATVGLGYSKLAEDKRSNGVKESDAALTRGQSKVPAGYRSKLDGTLEAIPGGPADLKINAAGVAKTSDARDVLGLLDEVDKILPKATGGGLGTGVDAVLGAGNITTKGANATAQLKAIEGALISKMPKMSGPQSDKDVLLYRQMAGEVGNSLLPVAKRQAAANMVRTLNEKYAGMPEGASRNATENSPTAMPSGFKVIR